MTAPDHTPYLLPTDLRTAEDVLAWLVERDGRRKLALTRYALAKRLDRERRQACRRAVAAKFLQAQREREQERWEYASRVDASCARKRRARCLRLALAFRAAAREP